MSEEEVEKLLAGDEEETELTEDEKEALDKCISSEAKKLASQEKKDAEDNPEDLDVHGKGIEGEATCKNLKAESREDLIPIYNSIVAKNRTKISHLVKSLETVFSSDQEEMRRTTSGAYNVVRGTVATTARMFDKRKDPGSKKDCEVFLLIDQSGSMCGSKMNCARETAIIFAEALMKLGVPHYVMGFTADDMDSDAVHIHYTTWKSTKRQHYSLAGMTADADNFDSYSIRYAAQVLESRQAKNRLLIVVSDGTPAALAYRSHAEGIEMTKKAISDVQKKMSVLGIAIGRGCDASILHQMYGRNFVHVEDESGLSNMLIKRVGKIVEKEFK